MSFDANSDPSTRRAAAFALILALAGCAHSGHDAVTSADQAIEIAIRKCGADMAGRGGHPLRRCGPHDCRSCAGTAYQEVGATGKST